MFRSTLEEHDQSDPAEALMREVGAQLRHARLERGEELPQVAENLRIKVGYLEALERGDLSIMPGRTYALGFLRSYADYLGFDGDDLIRQIKSTVENLTDHARLHIRTPLPESRLPKTSLVVLSLALVGGVYAGWMFLSEQERQLDVETVAEVPDDLRRPALETLPSATSAQDPEDPVTAPAPAGDHTPAEPAGPLEEPAETSDPEPSPSARPDIQAGVGDEARPADQGTLSPATRQSPATEAAAAEVPAREPFRANTPARSLTGSETPTGTETAGTSVDASELSSATAADALDRIIEDGHAGSAEAVGDAGAPPDSPAELSRGTADDGTDPAAEDGITPDAGPGEEVASTMGDVEQAGPAAGDLALPSGRDAGRSAPRRPAEDVLATLGPIASGSAGTPQVYERDNTDARVLIRARERSWIRITSESGDYLRTRTLEAGDVFLVPDRADLTLWTGNAGGLEMIVDGETLPPLGPEDTVKRDIPLDPESLFSQADTQR